MVSRGAAVDATMNVPAPIAGVVIEREANTGLNVDATTKLFTIADLSTVWVVGALYERDLSRVAVGSEATVTAGAYGAQKWQGRFSYVDPQIDPDTRTARVRVEIANPDQQLRLGMYADIQVKTADRQALMVPRDAIQTVGDRHVVYVEDPRQTGSFHERDVRLGEAAGELVEVTAGLEPGDRIVSKGSFFLRAEAERRRGGS